MYALVDPTMDINIHFEREYASGKSTHVLVEEFAWIPNFTIFDLFKTEYNVFVVFCSLPYCSLMSPQLYSFVITKNSKK